MGMLTKEDLKQIGRLLDKKNAVLKVELKEEIVTDVVGQVGEMLEDNIMPQFGEINKRLDRIETRLDGVETRLDGVENRMPTKSDIDRSLANFEVRLTERYDHRYVRNR